MAPAGGKQSQAKRRTRKRKRRVASSSSSSDSDSSSSSSSSLDIPSPKVTLPKKTQTQEPSSSEDSSESESDSSSSFDSTQPPVGRPSAQDIQTRKARSPTPPPVSVPVPSFLPSGDNSQDQTKEKDLKERFRKFWMASVADAFKSDLEEIQKEPNMTKSRLAILIDSLASGAEVFSSSPQTGPSHDINEMQVVLGED